MKFIVIKRVVPAEVPCNGCRACCVGDRIWMHPELGDRPGDHKGNVLVDDEGRWFLRHKDSSDECVYLNETGCSLFGDPRRPAICIEMDCRRLLNLPANKRHLVGVKVLEAARKLPPLVGE